MNTTISVDSVITNTALSEDNVPANTQFVLDSVLKDQRSDRGCTRPSQ